MIYPDSDEEIKVEGYAYVDVCGDYGPEIFMFINNSMIYYQDVFFGGPSAEEFISGFIQGDWFSGEIRKKH